MNLCVLDVAEKSEEISLLLLFLRWMEKYKTTYINACVGTIYRGMHGFTMKLLLCFAMPCHVQKKDVSNLR